MLEKLWIQENQAININLKKQNGEETVAERQLKFIERLAPTDPNENKIKVNNLFKHETIKDLKNLKG